MSSGKRFILAGIVLAVAALACSAPAVQEVSPTAEVAEVATEDGSTATPYVITATPEALVVTATPDTSGSTGSTGSSGGSGDSGSSGSSGGTDCLYNSVFVSDLTVPDGTEIPTGMAFTKTWRVQNNGCQTWPGGTTLIFVSGDQMSGPASVPVPETAPSGTQDISVNLTAPGSDGTYQAYWQLRTPDGIQFGDKIFVKINAKTPPPGVTPTVGLWFPPGGFKLIQTPTPTPLVFAPIFPLLTATFTATYGNTKASCAGPGTDYWVKVVNTGALTLESAYTKLEAPPGTQKDTITSNNPFRSNKNCNPGQSSLEADKGAWILAATTGPAIPSGTSAQITVKLCGLDDQGGICGTKTVSFTTP